MAKGKYYAPELKEKAVKMVVGLDCTYDLSPRRFQAAARGAVPGGRPKVKRRQHGPSGVT